MAKYKYSQEVWLVITGDKTCVKSVIENYSNKKVTYLLDNGMSVTGSDITDVEPEKPKRKKKYSPPAIKEIKEDVKDSLFNEEKQD